MEPVVAFCLSELEFYDLRLSGRPRLGAPLDGLGRVDNEAGEGTQARKLPAELVRFRDNEVSHS